MFLRSGSNISLHCWIATLALLIASCFGDGPLIGNPAEVDPVLDANLDQFWAIPVGRAGYPTLNDGPNPPGPPSFPGGSQPGPGTSGGAAFYPGPIPGTVQVGYFSGSPSYPPGNYGFNGNGVFGFSIPANALVQQQQQQSNNQNAWGSGFWSRFNPANRVSNLFNFPQRQPVHQYAFSASITNQNNRQPTQNSPQQPPSNNPTNVAPNPYYHPAYYQQSQNWYNGANYVPFGNPYFFPQNQQFSSNNNNAAFQQQQSEASDKNPSYNRPSIPVYNPPSSVPDTSDSQNNSTENPSTFALNQPLRTGPSDSGRPGIWGENHRQNWLHVPWIGNWRNRDVSPRMEYPGAALFSFQG